MTLDLCSVETNVSESLKELYSEFIENLSSHWKGHRVTVEDAIAVHNAIQDKLFWSLSSRSSSSFSLADRHIGHLFATPDGLDFRSTKDLVVQAGLRSFWKKHKTAIIVGIIAVAVIATVVVVSVATAGAGTGPATAIGAAAIGEAKSHLKDEKPASPQNQVPATSPPPIASNPISYAPPSYNGPLFLEDGVMLNGERYAYWEFLQKTRQEEFFANFLNAPKPSSGVSAPSYEPIPPQSGTSIIGRFFEAFGREFIGEEVIGEVPHPPLQTSHLFTTSGNRSSTCRIGGINGINTPLDYAVGHADHIKKFTPEQSIDWVYNNSHGALTDALLEVPLNYVGTSPNTAKILADNWVAFDKANKDNPKARYLQFCHSQGAIHVRNALLSAPKEIRERVMVVAIAPAAIISKQICFRSFNYASKKDIVPFGDFLWAAVGDTNEFRTSPAIEMALDRRRELILLDPHPDSTGIDHDFQSLTFVIHIENHIKDYYKNNGEYE